MGAAVLNQDAPHCGLSGTRAIYVVKSTPSSPPIFGVLRLTVRRLQDCLYWVWGHCFDEPYKSNG